MLKKLLEFDRELLFYINNFGIENHDGFWLFVTNPISWLPVYLCILIILWFTYPGEKFYKTFLYLMLVLGICALATFLVKISFGRIRPENLSAFEQQLRILSNPKSYSFFSGHAANSFAVTTFVVLVLRDKTKWVYLLFIWPILFSYSRLYLGVHYPSDILFGILVGVLIAYLIFKYGYQNTKNSQGY